MIDVLRQHIIKRLGNDAENLETVLTHFTEVRFPRNHFLVREGEVCKHVYFIVQGCLQVFTYDSEMNETTRDIVTEGTWCSELMSFGTGKPATENIRTVEPSELLAMHKNDFMRMTEEVPQFNIVYKQILETSYANSVYRINSFVSMSALERVQWLTANRPKLLTRVSSKLIASYLGIHKDVFSRLKGKL